MTTTLRLVGLAVLLVTLSSCAREWYRVREEESVRVRTEVTFFTEPAGADVSVNGSYRGTTPVMIPFHYRYRRVIYARERSYGVVRDTEERMLPEYFSNHFEVTVTKPGFEPAVHYLDLRGEQDMEVHVPLTAK
jgi:hypothetical protein